MFFVYVYVYVCVCMCENVFERVYVKGGGVEDRRVTAPPSRNVLYLLVPFDFWTQSQFF